LNYRTEKSWMTIRYKSSIGNFRHKFRHLNVLKGIYRLISDGHLAD
jgi:hypothetical protein